MKGTEIVHQARLEGVYSVMRKLQAVHDTFETRCKGSGHCCKIGLVLPLAECWNIATNLRRIYWLNAENLGIDEADKLWKQQLDTLIVAMYDDSWNPDTNEQDKHCVFFKNGCSIYEFRPLVCRAYGVIAPVQENVCPRNRLPDGGHELIRTEAVETLMTEFDSLIQQWGVDQPALDFSCYMPAGVLRFLLTNEEVQDLIANTDSKFWLGHVGYKHALNPENWGKEIPVTLRRKSV